MAGHSLGGVFAQSYATDNADAIKGLILMGSVLTRGNHAINDDGTTHFDFNVPTLTMGGSKDGLMRITRVAESWWHQMENIEPAQANMFPVYGLDGATHWSFASGAAPSAVKKKDLKPEISDDVAHAAFAA
jgi:pimeloyl-ACP methyl ester carboxylesterase